MRITVLLGAFFPVPPLRGGAVEKIWFALGQELARRGHTVTQVSRRCDGLPAEETLAGVRHLRIQGYDTPASLLRLKWLDLLYTRRALRVLPAADIILTNTFWAPLFVRPARHGLLYVHVARFPKGQLRWYRRATRLQTVSTPILEAMRAEAPRLAARFEVVPNPVEVPATVPAPEEREPVVLYAGRIHPEKGLALLVDAWARLAPGHPGWRLRLAGPWDTARGGGGEEFKRGLEARAARAGTSVEFTGGLFAPGALEAELRRAAVFVYPSIAERGETFGVAPLEAMAHGCPAVVSNLACFTDFIAHGRNGLVFDHRDADAAGRCAETLGPLLADPARRAALAAAARETARDFSVATVAGRYEESFRRALTDALPAPLPPPAP